MIAVDILSTFRGHKAKKYVEDADNDADRAKLALEVQSWIKEGSDVFLIDQDRITRRIKEYDPQTNEWILFSTRVPTPQPEGENKTPEGKRRGRPRKEERVSADGTNVAVAARSAGG